LIFGAKLTSGLGASTTGFGAGTGSGTEIAGFSCGGGVSSGLGFGEGGAPSPADGPGEGPGRETKSTLIAPGGSRGVEEFIGMYIMAPIRSKCALNETNKETTTERGSVSPPVRS
jgi:hypothetical protein